MSSEILAIVTKATFDAALAQDTGLNVDIQMPAAAQSPSGSSRTLIKGLVLIAEENLSWEIWFWSSATHGTDRNKDPWIGRWTFIATDGVTETGDPSTSYRYVVRDLDLPYVDDDGGGKLHMTVIPRLAAHVIHKELVVKVFLAPEIAWT